MKTCYTGKMQFSLTQKAIIAIGIVAFSYATLSVVVRLMNTGFGPFTQVYLRIGLGWLLTTGVFYNKIRFSRFFTISQRDGFLLFLMGTLGYGLAVDSVTLGTLHTTLLNVAIIASTTPFFVFIFSIFIFRKSVRYYLPLFMILAFYGVYVLATNSLLPVFNQFSSGDFFVVMSSIGFGVLIVGRKLLSNHLNIYEISFIIMLIAFLCSLLIGIAFKEPFNLAGFSQPIALFGLFLGGFLNLTATIFETFGFKHLNAVAGSQLLLLENLFAPIFGFVFYHEYILPVEFLGALLVVAGVWLYIKYGES